MRCSGRRHACRGACRLRRSCRSWAVNKTGQDSRTFISRIFVSLVANAVPAIELVVRIILIFDRHELCIIGPPTPIAPIRLCCRMVVVETNARHVVWDKLTKSSLSVGRDSKHGPNRVSHVGMNRSSIVGNIVTLSSQKVVDGGEFPGGSKGVKYVCHCTRRVHRYVDQC